MKPALVLLGILAFAPLATASPVTAVFAKGFAYSGSITTVSNVNGVATTMTSPLNVPWYYAQDGVTLPSGPSASIDGTGYINNEPPRPPPPGDLPPTASSVTIKVDNGQMTRTTTYTRPVTNNPSSPEGVDDGPWSLANDTSTQDAGGGGGGCTQKTSDGRDCPALN